MKIEVKETREINITPQLMAEVFWGMSDMQQADFFEALAAEVKKNKSAYSFGEMQWCYMASELRRRGGDANACYHALAVFSFDIFQQNGLQQRWL